MAGKQRRRRARPAPPTAVGFLPWFGTRVFGRDADVAAVRALIDGGERLVTLLGPAGVGKTRLAHEVARTVSGRRPARAVWFVELSAAIDHAQVVGAIERVLDPDGRPGASSADVLRGLAARLDAAGPALIVLDNCEQATPAVVAACRTLLGRTRAVQVVATSRNRLRLSFERVIHVAPLATDGDAALALIQDRIAMRGQGPARGSVDVAVLRAIVGRLDGVPLAIELAAARLDVMAPAALLAKLETQLDELTDDAIDRAPRQRTLRRAIAASWALLDAGQRRALSQLAVFRGGWTLDAAHAVLAVEDSELDVEALLRDLVDRSLVRREATAGGDVRFAMYEGLRQYAAEVLAASGARDATERRHAEHVIAATRVVADWSQTLDEVRKRAAEAERENLIVAFEHLIRDAGARDAIDGALIVASVLASIDLTHGPWDAAVERLGRALADRRPDLGSDELVADALCKRAYLLEHLGSYPAARADLARGIAAASRAGAVHIELDLLRTSIHLDVRDARAGEAAVLARRAVELAERLGDASERSLAQWGLALALHGGGETADALVAIDLALAIEEREVRAPRPAIYLALLAAILHELGRLDEATVAVDEAIALVRARNAPTYVAEFTLARGLIAVERGDRDAVDQLDAAAALARTTGDERTAFVAAVVAALATVVRGEPSAATGRLAAVRAARDRLGSEPRALFELVAATVRGVSARDRRGDRLGAALLGDDRRTPLFRFVRRVIAVLISDRAGMPTDEAAVLRVSADCSLVRLPDGSRVELGERAPARRLLRGLVVRHLRSPGDALTVPALAAEGWPGERIEPAAAKNRVHVALAELRRCGFRDLVQRSPRGYFLAPALRVAVDDG